MTKMVSCIAALTFVLIQCCASELMVEVDQGKLLGKSGVDRKGNTFCSFLAIPYAKPPIGDLRFAEPQEPEKWKGNLNATQDLPSCPQIFITKITGQEDCLFLNVHTPDLPRKGFRRLRKPVIVYIHGGSFVEGSGSTEYLGAEFLMPADVVLVTINYRLGLFGFLSSKDDSTEVPGNAALKDQIMALKWVKKNIKKFGGDPDSVTIVGESSGGVCAHLHMISPLSKGLFHRVIAMSGTAGISAAHGNPGTLEILAEKLNIRSLNKTEVLAKLRAVPKDDILEIQRLNFDAPSNEQFDLTPVVEKERHGAFLSTRPIPSVVAGEYNKVPLMLGYTNKEGLFVEVLNRLYANTTYVPQDFDLFVPRDFNITANERTELQQKIKTFYFGNVEPSPETLDKSIDISTDAWFLAGITNTIRAHLYHPEYPVYFYRFSGDTALNYYKLQTPETSRIKGASHVDDLGYIFKTVKTPVIVPGSSEDIAIDNMVELFTTFAKEGCPKSGSVEWLPVTTNELNYLNTGTVLTPGVDPDRNRLDFWKGIYDKYAPLNNTEQ